MKKYTLVMCCLWMLGCTSSPATKYPEPLNDPKAELTILVPKLDVEGFQLYKRILGIRFYSDDTGCPWRSNVNIKDTYLYTVYMESKNFTKTIDIPVGKEIFISVSDSYAGSSCEQSVRFVPVVDGKYVLDIFAHDSAIIRCSSELKRSDGGGFKPESTAQYAKPNSIFKGLFTYDEVCEKGS